ncbi:MULTISPECIES: DUF6452 family protein [Flavobacterium]|uniref:Lipoprotein n=2 Tax=Flavobacterium TaxID=237 RepID=A0A940X8T9_9FLAO|nr:MULTISPECIES: DUF6452 family protein [Flavobacterium]MBP4137642.1 hypothetical protein [Flavobacterium geliluteum]MDX6181669.1 DUF6452 family protein [Flavobacterium sp. Fl-33]MDX6185297.1 DUF6452 family protein [Flavobacterium sp. Fl-77]UFH37403.1 DUF6452 family protein [Flavobacterium sp. F-70]
MKKIISLFLLLAFGFSGCEKDDICDANTPTTPRLVLTFYFADQPTVLKPVTSLKVYGEGQDATKGIIFNETAITDELKYTTNASKILIPLDPSKDSVTYHFISNFSTTNPALQNDDILKFTYTRENVYVSRACGFKTIYKLNTSVERLGGENINTYWMKNINVITPNIESENETHVEVFF